MSWTKGKERDGWDLPSRCDFSRVLGLTPAWGLRPQPSRRQAAGAVSGTHVLGVSPAPATERGRGGGRALLNLNPKSGVERS